MLNRNFTRFIALSILAIAAIFSISFRADAQELIVNGGFETAMTGWTTYTTNFTHNVNIENVAMGAGYVRWSANPTYGSELPYNHASFPQEGGRSCIQSLVVRGTTGNAVSRFYQNITVPANRSLTVSWKQRVSQMNAGNVTTQPIVLRVYIRNTSDVILATLNTTTLPAQTSEVRPWETFSINLGQTYAGQTIRLDFDSQMSDANAPNYDITKGVWEVDAVSANAAPPTAATASVAGRVTNSRGEGVYKARVTATDGDGEILTAMTNPFGYYSFSVVEIGQSYILQLKKRNNNLSAAQRVITPFGDLTEENFVLDDEPPPSNKSKKK